MGLDVTAYHQLKRAEGILFDEDGSPVGEHADMDLVRVWSNPEFPGREDGLIDGAYYESGPNGEGLSIGYGAYNGWRELLAKLAGYEPVPYERYGHTELRHDAAAWAVSSGPFWEQINFADNEGCIGPVVCAKLAKDYADFAEKAEAEGGPFWARYQEWKACFDLAADGGMVDFH